MKTVLVMPGTTSMPPSGILAAVAERYPRARVALQEIDGVAGEFGRPPVTDHLVVGRAPAPGDPESLYLALFGVSICVFEALIAEGVEPYALTGHSIGELWSLAAAGGMSVKEAARLACLRSQVLTEHGWPGALMAVSASAGRVQSAVDLVDHPELVIACDNSPRQSVVSGPRVAVDSLRRVVGELGWDHHDVVVPHPTHTPAVAAAAAALADRARGSVTPRALRRRIHSTFSNQWVRADYDPVDMLVRALTSPVRFAESIRALHSFGVDSYVECGAGALLSGSIRATAAAADVWAPLEAGPQANFRERPAAPGPVPPRKPDAVPTITQPSAPAPAARQIDAPVGEVGRGRDSILAVLRKLYAEGLGYPEGVLEEDAELEADLGVESIKQTRLLVRVGEEFGVTALTKNVRLAGFRTLGDIADAVHAEIGAGPGGVTNA